MHDMRRRRHRSRKVGVSVLPHREGSEGPRSELRARCHCCSNSFKERCALPRPTAQVLGRHHARRGRGRGLRALGLRERPQERVRSRSQPTVSRSRPNWCEVGGYVGKRLQRWCVPLVRRPPRRQRRRAAEATRVRVPWSMLERSEVPQTHHGFSPGRPAPRRPAHVG